MARTLEQKRAAYALGRVEGYIDNDKKTASKYKSLVKGFSAMVLHNGLGQSVAFLLSKSKDNKKDENEKSEHDWLVKDLTDWVVKDREIFSRGKKCDTFIDCIVKNDRDCYVQATEETLLLVNWLAKFANAFIESDKEK